MTTDGSPSLPQRDELREEVAALLWAETHDGALSDQSEGFRAFWLNVADAVLALPVLAARRDDLAERVARVEALATAWDDRTWRGRLTAAPFVRALRAALTSDRAATEGCPSGCGRNEPCPDPWHDRRHPAPAALADPTEAGGGK